MRSMSLLPAAVVLACLVATMSRAEPPQQGDPPLAPSHPRVEPEAASPWKVVGTVAETLDAGQYTYVKIDTGTDTVWAASPRTQVGVGDTAFVPDGPQVADFFSGSLHRRFELIYLVPFIEVQRKDPSPSGGETPPAAEAAIDLSGLDRAEGGRTIREIFDGRHDLAGRDVTVRGKIAKYQAGILGKNWIHLQDGTAGPHGLYDLVVTTTYTVDVGDIVVVRGIVVIDRGLGYGYRYDVLVEATTVTVE